MPDTTFKLLRHQLRETISASRFPGGHRLDFGELTSSSSRGVEPENWVGFPFKFSRARGQFPLSYLPKFGEPNLRENVSTASGSDHRRRQQPFSSECFSG
jgi:hypothetical protein